MFIVGSVVAVGGLRRPTDGLDVFLSTDPANLPLQTRLLLGPRVALIEPRDSLLRPSTATTVNAPPVPVAPASVMTYVVQAGDTVWDIGARLNVGMYSVLWSNDLSEDDVVRPGQELRIPPVPGVAYQVKPSDTLDGIAARFKVEPTTVVDANRLRPGEPLPAERWIVVPGGELPITVRPETPIVRPVAPATRPNTPASAPRPALAPRPAPAPVAPAPAPVAPAVATGRLQWPTRGSITTYYSGWHPGIDIAAPFGTPIGVSDAGRVVYAGWDRTGYGNRIIVNHGNGFTTTYNHLSAFLVQVGQSVSKGQVIARMGSTGNSTGPHLHFEILRNGGYVNPLNALN
jgi:murein DD-endopeptidase MepM/ murein hydrolase activator NlpD